MAAEKDFPVALKRLLFPKTDHIESLQLTKQSVYSVSPPDQAKAVADIIEAFFDPAEVAITDATSNVGGNLFAMMHFKRINAVEIDGETIQMLQRNVDLLFPDANNVVFIHDDYNNVKGALKQNVIFMDPPWGGPDYFKQKDKELYMSGVPLTKLLADDLQYAADLIVVKVPTTYPVKKLFAQKKYMFQAKIPVARPGKVVYYLLVLANRYPKRKLPKKINVARIDYRRYLSE